MNGAFAHLEAPRDLRAARAEFNQLKAENVLKTKTAEVVRLIVPKGKEIPPHRAPGELLVQCLQGRVQPGPAQRTNTCIRAFQQERGSAAALASGQVGHAVERLARFRQPGGVGNLHIWVSIGAHDGLRIAGLA